MIQMLEAKARRDVIRDALIRVLRDVPSLPDDVIALLRADTRATNEFATAVANHAAEQEEERCSD